VRPHSSLNYLTPSQLVAREARPTARQTTGRQQQKEAVTRVVLSSLIRHEETRQVRAISTRYDKLANTFLAAVALVCVLFWIN
jgi:transposase